MMKFPLLLIVFILFIQVLFAQSAVGPAEKRVTDTICNCLSAVDLSKITNKAEALAAFTDCFSKRMDLLMAVADEKHVDETDLVAMKQVGIDISRNLMNQNCAAFTKISIKMAGNVNDKTEENGGITEGKLKRMDLKGFNYLVISDDNNSEKSFIWLKQFPGSEKFMNGLAGLTGKQVKIRWHEFEVYLPQAKGYYKIKEIMGVEFL